jgi:uncharacterized protein
MKEMNYKSGIYEGIVSHCRFAPKIHRFNYRVFMMYLDLDELDSVFCRNTFWSVNRFNLASFRREDYLGNASVPLKEAVHLRIREENGEQLDGPVRMLTNLRYFGFIINPITCYYCFDKQDNLKYIVAEVTNTPWGERHSYVIPAAKNQARTQAVFNKNHHVSPFMPMDMEYHWRSSMPGKRLNVYMENHQGGTRVLNAAIYMKQCELSPLRLNVILLKYPFMTMQVALGIYWQALKIWWKKIPFLPHPKRRESEAGSKLIPEQSAINHSKNNLT